MNKLVLLCALVVFDLTHTASADEQMRILASGGDWAAVAHYKSMTASPDVCLLANMKSDIAIRRDEDDIKFRAGDENWSLPAGVSGTIGISVGSFNKALDIGANTSTRVIGKLDKDDAVALLVAMDKASQMTVTIGKAKPRLISLNGSTRAATAFKTCAGIKAVGQSSPSSNPFQ